MGFRTHRVEWFVSAIVVVVAIAILGFDVRPDSDSRWEGAGKVLATTSSSIPPNLPVADPKDGTPGEAAHQDPGSNEGLPTVLEKTLSLYKEQVAALETNVGLMALLVVVSVLLIRRKTDNLNIPLLGIECPTDWLHYVVPSAMLYLWCRFGFLLDDCIGIRKDAWTLMAAMESPSAPQALSLRRHLHDSGLLDAWFSQFGSGFHEFHIDVRTKWFMAVLLALTYGVLMSLANACIIVVFQAGVVRFGDRTWVSWGSKSLPWIATIVLTTTHLVFAYYGLHPNWVQCWAAVLVVGFVWLGLRMQRSVDAALAAAAAAAKARGEASPDGAASGR